MDRRERESSYWMESIFMTCVNEINLRSLTTQISTLHQLVFSYFSPDVIKDPFFEKIQPDE